MHPYEKKFRYKYVKDQYWLPHPDVWPDID